jgi:MFS superfamily sulfate permease-like transporter
MAQIVFTYLGLAPTYQRKRSWLGLDVIAGLMVWVLMIPKAVAYAQIAGVPSHDEDSPPSHLER